MRRENSFRFSKVSPQVQAETTRDDRINKMEEKIKQLVKQAQRIVIVQADNPDADSLGSALALEHILGDLDKDIALYCGVNIPEYLRYMRGWDRVLSDLPHNFDLSIIVDASTYILFEKLEISGQLAWLKAKPCVVLDHHADVEKPLDFATAQIIDPSAASAGQLIYDISRSLGWSVNTEAAEHIMMSILGDTQGLTNELTTASTYRTMADLTELGANRPQLEELRRDYGRMAPKIYAFKADLIKHTVFDDDGRIASVMLNQAELNEYSPLYNPVPLIQPDMLQIKNVCLSIVYKVYDDGRITGAIRSNHAYPVADKLAKSMGGGGHPHASGFKITDGRPFNEIKSDCTNRAIELLNQIDKEKPDEIVQHTFQAN